MTEEDLISVRDKEAGNSWRRTISCIKTPATVEALYGCFSPTKWAYLDIRSTTTKMDFTPLDMGSPSIKSIEISYPTVVGTGSGCKSPVVDCCEYFCCLQIKQHWTYRATDFLIPPQNQSPANLRYVLTSPECPPTTESWYSFSKWGIICEVFGMTYLPLNNNRPSTTE